MAINYTEKGYGLHLAVAAAGHWLRRINTVWTSDNDSAVQAIINSYDPLPYSKQTANDEIKATALEKIQTIFPAIPDIDTVNLIAEIWQSLVSQAKSPTTNMQTVISIYTAAKGGIQSVNAATDQAGIDSAVAAITWPI